MTADSPPPRKSPPSGGANQAAARELPTLPDGFSYGVELDECLRLAAWIGTRRRESTPISFSSVLGAFLIQDQPVAKWFQGFANQHKVDTAAIFGGELSDTAFIANLMNLAATGRLPEAEPLQSRSFLEVRARAMDVARQVGGSGGGPLGGRHVMAAYVCYQYSAHEEQIKRWNISRERWQRDFFDFAIKQYPGQAWNELALRVLGSNRQASTESPKAESPKSESPAVTVTAPATLIGDFTDDNPLANSIADLLKVDDEAEAFARLMASEEITPPLAIGVFGEWGSGKTFFMRRMRDCIDFLSTETKKFKGPPKDKWPYLEDIVQIQFDAWHYAEQNLWASLVDYIFAELDSWMLKNSGDDPAGVDHVLDRLATTQQLKLEALETLILRRSERQAAEAKAETARARYQEAVKRCDAIRPSSYLLAAIKSLLTDHTGNPDINEIKSLRKQAAGSLGIPELKKSDERLEAAVNDARTEAGRARLVAQSLFAKLGSFWGIVAIMVVLFAIPAAAAWFKEFLADKTTVAWLKEINSSLVAASTLLLGIATSLSAFVKRARQGLSKLDEFDRKIQVQIDAKRKDLQQSAEAIQDQGAQEELQKSQQAFDAAKRALEVADANLLAARQDFESGTARGRLNAFIRSKVTSGEYAKHLGIVASIRRDFSQLASLMRSSNDPQQEENERKRLAEEANTRVDRFIGWLDNKKGVKLTIDEVTELMNLLEPAAAVEKLAKHGKLFSDLLQGQTDELEALRKKLGAPGAARRRLPRFSRIVLYIDDLDRCAAAKVVDVLQAVHLLLSFPLFVVVVAVDARWVSRALRDHYPGLFAVDDGGPGEIFQSAVVARPYDYLEKIFQIPYWVRRMDGDAARDFVHGVASRKKGASPGSVIVIGGASPPPLPGQPGNAGLADNRGNSRAPSGPPSAPIPGHAGRIENASFAAPGSRQTAAEVKHAGVKLDEVEIQMLRKFAPFVGDTPRRAIRFVNIYRLVKTSLPARFRNSLLGENGQSPLYRALIAELAVANGMPNVANDFYQLIARSPQAHTIEELKISIGKEMSQLSMLVATLRDSGDDIPGAQALTVEHLQQMVGFARRYSFERG